MELRPRARRFPCTHWGELSDRPAGGCRRDGEAQLTGKPCPPATLLQWSGAAG